MESLEAKLNEPLEADRSTDSHMEAHKVRENQYCLGESYITFRYAQDTNFHKVVILFDISKCSKYKFLLEAEILYNISVYTRLNVFPS